ncbi:hypothetical protein HJC23_003012 [Cyclotella cryptica]|uniref:Uncharacterized protein n=1 Tax=Cyclotella cryptica TaxID=29204 RepID=A0ABD3PSM4_9STRA
MARKSLFKHKSTPAPASAPAPAARKIPVQPAVELVPSHELDPSVEMKLRTNADNDTLSTHSYTTDLSDISPMDNLELPFETDEENTLGSVANNVILSTLCCHGGSVPGEDQDAHDIKGEEDASPLGKEKEDDDGFISKLAGTFLYFIGQAPPVQIVRCMEERSVDQSEVSIPQVLTDMAEEYEHSRRKLEEKDRYLKEVYQRQQRERLQQLPPLHDSRRKKNILMSMKTVKGSASNKSSDATVSSNSSLFDKLKKSGSKLSRSRSKNDDGSGLYEI